MAFNEWEWRKTDAESTEFVIAHFFDSQLTSPLEPTMPVITLLLAALYLLAIYGLLLVAGYARKGIFTRPRDVG